MTLREECKKYKQKHGTDAPYPVELIYGFLFKHYDNPMDEYDPWDIVDCLFANLIGAKVSNLPVDIHTLNFKDSPFPRYPIPMIIVHGLKESEYWYWNCQIPVSISAVPKILISDELLGKRSNLTKEEWKEIFAFVSRNHDILLDQWNCRIEEKYGVDWNDVDVLWRVKIE